MQTGRIDLAREPVRLLGRLTLDPPVRQILRDDGVDEVVEPRVMQVLLALAQAEGGIVTRDMLSESCWEGRVVGEDAINRVISRLRRVQEGIGEGSFRIETITKVGYRLIGAEGVERRANVSVAMPPEAVPQPPATLSAPRRFSRRGMIGGGIALGAATVGGGLWLRRGDDQPPPEVRDLMIQGQMALREVNPEGFASAAGIFRRVTEIAPGYADGWGYLALVTAGGRGNRDQSGVELRTQRTREAVDRALAIDPGNPIAKAALVQTLPRIGHWLDADVILRPALRDHPDNPWLLTSQGSVSAATGRMRSAAGDYQDAIRTGWPNPGVMYFCAVLQWAAGRLDDADRTIDRAMQLFPKHFAVWFTRFYLSLYTGRADEALTMAGQVDRRPNGIPAASFDDITLVARAMRDRAPADVDAAIAMSLASAKRGAGFAENSIQFAAALGRLDTAFQIADAYFFGRGFTVADNRFTAEQGGVTTLADRRTYILFLPSTAPMRRDPRFGPLVQEVGLERYWAESGRPPDFRLRG